MHAARASNIDSNTWLEPGYEAARPTVMSVLIDWLVGAIFEMACYAVVKFLGMENWVEFLTCIFGFICILGGLG